jgi:transcriptional regulator with XRE-family HTH domain
MAKKTAPLLPSTDELLFQFGARLRAARLRRRLPAKQVAERAGMSPMTLRSVERGGSGVTMGAYLAVMQVLGIEKDLNLLAKADPVGRELQDARLPTHSKAAPRPASVYATPVATASVPTASVSTTELQRLIESSSQEQLRKIFESLPSEQLRRAIEALPETQMRKALAGLPPQQLRQTFEQLNTPANEVKKQIKATVGASDWIEKGGFSSADALAGLIKSASPPLSKKRR